MKPTAAILTASILIATAACTDRAPSPQPVAVIEGWIDSDGYPVVVFTSSLLPHSTGGNVSDMMIRWGRVTISDGEQTVVLTGGPNHDFLPPFRYYTFDITGRPGHTYTITADYDNLHASATCAMPEPTEIDSIVFGPAGDNDTLRACTLYFTAPDDVPAYYNIEVRDSLHRGRPYPSILGAIETRLARQSVSVAVLRPKNELDTADYTPHFHRGENIEISLCRVTREVYDFWYSFDSDVAFGQSVFVSSAHPLSSNISGGYGVWSARGTSTRHVKVK